jgi:hypothetical protein
LEGGLINLRVEDINVLKKRRDIDGKLEVRTHPEFPMYYISEDGRVFGKRNSLMDGDFCIEIAHVVLKHGYVDYVISDVTGRRRHKLAHRLVAECFIDNPEDLPEVNHKDEDKQNNHVSNLEWVTHRDNIRHSSEDGGWEKLDKEQQNKVIKRLKSGDKQADIAKDFGCAQTLISKIARDNGLRKQKRISDEMLTDIRGMYLQGVDTKDIMAKHELGYQTVHALVTNKRRYCEEYQSKLDN